MRWKFAGSWSRTHRSLGSVKPVSTGLAIAARTFSLPMVRLMESTCGWLRWSHQIRAGRTTSPPRSSSVSPCIWPDNPTPRTSLPATPAAASAPRMASTVARHQSSGHCSAHRGRSIRMSSCAAVNAARTLPSRSTSRARVPPVPISIPSHIKENQKAKGKKIKSASGTVNTQRRRVLLRCLEWLCRCASGCCGTRTIGGGPLPSWGARTNPRLAACLRSTGRAGN